MARKGTFFDERADESEVKARIIEKYFSTWANIIMPTAQKRDNKIGYIDLYAGPGRYRNGAASTPLLVIEKAIADSKLAQMLVTLLNDGDKNHSDTLQSEIDKLPGIEKLKYRPRVFTGPVDEETSNRFDSFRLVPSFTFLDPFGYKGLSLKIVNAVIKEWGCDCVFFFNYNRINAGLGNEVVENHMDALFTKDRADNLRGLLANKAPTQRELLILENMCLALKDMNAEFVLPFRFKKNSRTSHYLVFVTKHFKGYEVMKDIMARESSTTDEGVASFAYSPADASTPFLFSFNKPASALRRELAEKHAGQTVKMWDIYRQHSVDTPYIKKNYKDVLKQMESDGEITVPAHRKGSFADDLMVTFPAKAA